MTSHHGTISRMRQDDDRARDEEPVSDGIEQLSHARHHVEAPGDDPVEPVGDRTERQQREGQTVILRAQGHPDEDRDQQQAEQRQEVGDR